MRALLRRLRRDQDGFTLVEVIATVVILGIIMVPLGTTMVVGFRTVLGIQDRLSDTADVQKLSTYFPSDVASVDSDGVNPTQTETEAICKATPSEESLITFRWDSDLGLNGETVVRYLATGSGENSKLVRRICRGSNPPVEIVLANHFGDTQNLEASRYITAADDPLQTPTCGIRKCFVDIHGSYEFHLDAQRRVEGNSGIPNVPDAPTNVHTLGGFQRVRVYWTDPALEQDDPPITGYYIEQTPGGIVGGSAAPTFFAPGTGTTGAVISGLTNNTSYTFRVRAVNISGNGPWSDMSAPVTPGPTTPEPPFLDTAVGDANTSGQVNATWSLPADYGDGGSALTGFKLSALNPDAIATTTTIMNPAARAGSVVGLEDNTRYKVQVTALNSYGEGSPSPVPITALTRPAAPGTPTAAATGTAGSVTLNFTAPEGGDPADLTNVRAHYGSTFTDPVAFATACPDSVNCSITITGINVSSSTSITVQAQNATAWGPESGPVVIAADTTPPTVAITFPGAGQYGTAAWNAGCSNAGGAICGTASDALPGAVASVTVTVRRSSDSRYWTGTAGTTTTQWSTTVQNLTATGTTDWTRALTTASLTNGVTYTVTAVAKDTVNQSSTTATRVFGYVTANPTAALTAPANGADVQGSVVTVSGTAGATSPATVVSAEFQYKPSASGTWISIATDTATPYTTPWDTTALADGDYDLRMIVVDSAGNTATSATRTITVDNNPPTGSITAPANGAYVHGTAQAVSANSADAGSGVANATFQYKPTAGSTWTQIGAADTSSPYAVSWNTSTLTDGSYDLRVITTDNVGLQFTSPSITVISDNTGPSIGSPTVTGTLGSNGWYTSNVTVTWPTPTDSAGIASTTGCGTTNITANTAGQVVTCSATDNAGNTASNSVTIKRDTTAPTGSLTAPANGASVTGNVPVSSDSADVTSGVGNATFQYSPAGAGTWTTIGAPDTVTPYSVSWNTAAVADGNYDLRVVTTDNAGNSFTSTTRTVYVDRTAPTVTITFPNAPQYGTASWNAGCSSPGTCGTADDGAGDVASVTVTVKRSSDNRYWNGTAGTGTSVWSSTTAINLTATGTNSWLRTLTTASLQTGVTYTVTAVAADSVGLNSATATKTFTYLTTAPTATLTAPNAGVNVQGNVTVSGTATATSPATLASATFQYSPAGAGTWTSIAVDTVSPYTTPWNTNALPDGDYDLRLVATDSAGNVTNSAIRTVTIDNNAPTGTITAPTNGSYVHGNAVAVASNSADDGSGVANATFQYKPTAGSTWTTIGAADTSSPYAVSWNTTALADGSYDLRVITTDNVGLQFTSPVVTVQVDNTGPSIGAPTVTGTAGANGWYTSNVSVTWPAPTDNAGIASSTGCGTTNITANTAGQVVTCTATDNAGNTASNSVTIKVDKNTPTGSLTTPANGAAVTGNVNVTSDSADVGSGVANATFQYSPAGAGTWNAIGAPDTSTPYGVTWNTASVPDGSYDLRVITTDNAGLSVSSAIRTVSVDTTAPTVTITFPADAADYNVAGWAAGCVTNDVCGTAADSGGVAGVTVSIRRSSDSRYWTGNAGTTTTQWSTTVQNLPVTGTTAWNRIFTTASLQNGVTYTMVATATDTVGLTGTDTNVFDYDTANPTGSITAPTGGANVTGTVNVTSSSADTAPGGVASATFQYKPTAGSTWTTIGAADTVAPYAAAWDTSALADGQYDLRVITVDRAGNSFTSATVTVRIDSLNPTGELTAPANGAVVGGSSVTVSSNSADAGAGVLNATFQYSPASAGTWTTIGTPDTSNPYSVTWNTSALAQGSYDLRVITTDNAGNSYTSVIRTVSVDSTPPTVTIVKPADTAAYNAAGWATGCATNDVCGTAADSGPGTVAGVTVSIRRNSDSRYWNGSAGATTTQWSSTTAIPLPVNGTTAWNRILTTASLTNGVTYTMVATAVDGVGLTGTDTSVFVYDTTNPTGSITAPTGGANVRGNAVTVSSSSADTAPGTVASATFQLSPIGAGVWTTIGAPDTSSPYSVAWDSTTVTDGQYDLRVVTTDNAGNTFTSATATVRVDNTLPTGSLTAPANGATLRGTTVAVSSNSADTAGSGVLNATFQRSPIGAGSWTTIGAADTVAPYTQNFDTTTVADGQYDLRVVTTDNAGNVFNSPTITVTVDNAGPSIVASATGTVGTNGWYTTTIGLSWTVTDAVSGVATQTNCGPQTFSTDTSTISVTCTATDNAGNSSSGTFTAKRDATAPTATLTAPTSGSLLRGNAVATSGTATDATSGVLNVQFQRSPAGANTWTTISTDTSSPYTGTWDTTGVADGSYDLRALTTDNAGNQTASAINTVTVDNTKPTPSSLSLNNGAGQTLGRADATDFIVITYSEPINASTFCSAWTGGGDKSLNNATVSLATSDDMTFASSSCGSGLDIGSIDVIGNYNSSGFSTRTFSNSTVTWTEATRTLRITLGTASGGTQGSGVNAAVPVYTPNTSIADIAGNTMNATNFNGTSSRF